MKTISEDIKNKTYKTCYLLFGTERYLVATYRSKLKDALVPPDDTINFNSFDGKGLDWNEVMSLGNTMPFFSDHRVIIIDGSGVFKGSGDTGSRVAEWIKTLPETTTVIFSETDVDKRSAPYKAVAETGYASEMNGLTENDLMTFIGQRLKKNGYNITGNDASYLLVNVGSDMQNLSNELEKLISYALGRTVITREDIDAVCVKQITGKIFDLTDAVGEKNKKKAMHAYSTMLALRERPAGILYRITSHFNYLLQVKDLVNKGKKAVDIAQALGIKQYPAEKYCKQCKNFTSDILRRAVELGLKYETDFKSGKMDEEIAAEMFLVSLLEP
ncbi:MAG: DNA polymerase III subunit delta [Lachnospiraceae bacterium]|nr:DNA polymerase III subunit delta [Lachnospiraceae bacterium]